MNYESKINYVKNTFEHFQRMYKLRDILIAYETLSIIKVRINNYVILYSYNELTVCTEKNYSLHTRNIYDLYKIINILLNFNSESRIMYELTKFMELKLFIEYISPEFQPIIYTMLIHKLENNKVFSSMMEYPHSIKCKLGIRNIYNEEISIIVVFEFKELSDTETDTAFYILKELSDLIKGVRI